MLSCVLRVFMHFYSLLPAVCSHAEHSLEHHKRHHLLRFEQDLQHRVKKAQQFPLATAGVVAPARSALSAHGAANNVHMSEPSCEVYRVPESSLPSGYGNMYEYGHFMMDFAPPIYFHLQHAGSGCKTLIVPAAGEWLLTSPDGGLSTKHVFDFFFGPMKLSIERYNEANRQTGMMIDINPHDRPWATFDAEVYTTFREYAWKTVATAASSEPMTAHDIVVIKRISPSSDYKGPRTGAQRRKLPEEFFTRLVDAVQKNKSWSVTVESFETKSMYWQVEKTHRAKILLGQTGAGLINTLFLRPGGFVVEVGINPEKKLPPCASDLAERLGLKYASFNGADFQDAMIPKGEQKSMSDDDQESQMTEEIGKALHMISDFIG